MGFTVVYEYAYSSWTASTQISNIRAGCTSSTILCVGGRATSSDILLTVACGSCFIVTNTTVLNIPVLDNGVFWYNTPNKCFGFAPNASINQSTADIFDTESRLRLSWHLDVYMGFRLGSLSSVYGGDYYKIILKK
jgi:hypothetical protein